MGEVVGCEGSDDGEEEGWVEGYVKDLKDVRF